MKIYDSLYLGDIAKGERYNILKAIRSKKSRFGTYVITEAHSGSAILDILTLTEFIKNYYDNFVIVFFSKNDKYSKGAKHMEIKYFAIKEVQKPMSVN